MYLNLNLNLSLIIDQRWDQLLIKEEHTWRRHVSTTWLWFPSIILVGTYIRELLLPRVVAFVSTGKVAFLLKKYHSLSWSQNCLTCLLNFWIIKNLLLLLLYNNVIMCLFGPAYLYYIFLSQFFSFFFKSHIYHKTY